MLLNYYLIYKLQFLSTTRSIILLNRLPYRRFITILISKLLLKDFQPLSFYFEDDSLTIQFHFDYAFNNPFNNMP